MSPSQSIDNHYIASEENNMAEAFHTYETLIKIVLMLGHRLRRWPNIKTALG